MRSILTVAALLSQLCSVGAFVVPVTSTNHLISSTELCASQGDAEESQSTCTRRQAWVQASQVIAGTVFLGATPAFAAKDKLEADKEKLQAGYKRLNYLLDNWEKETTDCKTKTQYSSASSDCERTPLNVQYYLGYRSTEDPLFRADKTMRRLEGRVKPGDEVEYLEAMEKFNEKAEEGRFYCTTVS